MSTAAISYKRLEEASGQAQTTAKRLDRYRESLWDDVYRKLDDWGLAQEAMANVGGKIAQLEERRDQYDAFAKALADLQERCRETDEEVERRAAELTGSFKENHGIRSGFFENTVGHFCVSLGNRSAAGRWLEDRQDDFYAAADGLKEWIRAQFDFGGGREYLKGTVAGILETAAGFLTVVSGIAALAAALTATVVTGGAAAAAIAAIVGGTITLINGLVNMQNEEEAFRAAQAGDPSTARRRSEVNSLQDYMRSSFLFGADGENYEYSRLYNGLALGMDLASLACAVTSLVRGAGKLLGNGCKWISANWGDIRAAIRVRGLPALGDYVSVRIFADFGENLSREFFDFSSVRRGAGSIKNMINLPKEMLTDGVTLSSLAGLGISGVLLPGLTAFSVDSAEPKIALGEGGQLYFDFTENIRVSEITDLLKRGSGVIADFRRLFPSKLSSLLQVLGKFSEEGGVCFGTV